jgi:predicted FMN-binding regulatory protein PaiB
MPQSESTTHTFAEYAARRDAQVAELVRHKPFAAVISTDHGVPVATHVPVIMPPSQQLNAGGAVGAHDPG